MEKFQKFIAAVEEYIRTLHADTYPGETSDIVVDTMVDDLDNGVVYGCANIIVNKRGVKIHGTKLLPKEKGA
ncbi:MAG: hypothetical protein H7836_17825 [Magnetococcus sp. YQC-3]